MPEPKPTPACGGIHDRLGAYLDGELDPRGQSEVRAHLATCPACQTELAELSRLSQLLQAAPLPEFTPALDFKAQFMLQLPRRAAPQPNPGPLAWLAPALILASWIFLQIAMNLSTLVALASQAGLLPNAAWLAASPQEMQWFSAAQATLGGMLGPQTQTGLQVLNQADLWLQNLGTALLWQVGLALVYGGALALLWKHKARGLGSLFTTE